jgi:hypothetical protein
MRSAEEDSAITAYKGSARWTRMALAVSTAMKTYPPDVVPADAAARLAWDDIGANAKLSCSPLLLSS